MLRCIFVLFIFLTQVTQAQTITDHIRTDGKSINVGRSTSRWQPLLDAADNSNVKVTRNLKYGPDKKQGFDLYEPLKAPTAPSPIIVFLHGGSFVAGDKAMYANVGYHFAKKGITSIIMTYRLAPEFKWPKGTIDLSLQLKWIRDHKDRLRSADTSKVFLFGHSAGAQHVASYIFEEKYQIENDGVKGAILASGSVYDTSILKSDADPQYYDYFGRDASKYADRSILDDLEGRKIPVFVSYAEYDKDNFQYQASKIIDGLYKRDKHMPTVSQLIDHNHLSEVFHFNTGENDFSDQIIKFINSSIIKSTK
jgi:triacylglycerol lipase